MKIFTFILLTLLLIEVQAKDSKWQNLIALKEYPPSAYTLKSDVACLEIRRYIVEENTNKRVKQAPWIVLSIISPSVSRRTLKHFKKIKPNLSLSSDIRKDELHNTITNAMVLNRDKKMMRMYEIVDVISFLGEIDTPAEVQLVLWLYGYDGFKYRKTSEGYAVKIEKKTIKCIGDNDLEERFISQLFISKQGKLSKKKLLKHTKKSIKRELPLLKKPAIYLYPKTKQRINVSLAINGTITTSIPLYAKGWSVIVEPNGTINNQYDYLFYENTLNTMELPNNGWIKRANVLDKWFDIILPRLGFNSKEKEQFKAYWLPSFDKEKLYEIKLFERSFLAKNMKLSIDPKPDTLIRVIFSFKQIKERYSLRTPQITTPKRVGFHVLEWGGMMATK